VPNRISWRSASASLAAIILAATHAASAQSTGTQTPADPGTAPQVRIAASDEDDDAVLRPLQPDFSR
jgi:hypothetical protein